MKNETNSFIENTNNFSRLYGLDLLRFLSAYIVFLFHTNIHLKCSYGFLDYFIRMGHVFMTAFFLLSGYILFLKYSKYNLIEISRLKNFYLKRIIGIIPIYYFVSLLYVLIIDTRILTNTKKIIENIVLLPIEILGCQSNFSSLFSYSHNSGTWFIPCLIAGYALFPFLQEIIKQLTSKQKIISTIILYLLLIYSPFIVVYFKLNNIYSNPFFRLIEFYIGMVLASFYNSFVPKKADNLFSFIIEFAILILTVSLFLKYSEIKDCMLYLFFTLPFFCCILITCSHIKSAFLSNSKILKYLSEISYCIFFAQFFTFIPLKKLFNYFSIDENIYKILISHIICLIISVVLHELIEKKGGKFLKTKLLNKNIGHL